jgi:hypothetical protein
MRHLSIVRSFPAIRSCETLQYFSGNVIYPNLIGQVETNQSNEDSTECLLDQFSVRHVQDVKIKRIKQLHGYIQCQNFFFSLTPAGLGYRYGDFSRPLRHVSSTLLPFNDGGCRGSSSRVFY